MIEAYTELYPRIKERVEQCKGCKYFTEYKPPERSGGTFVFGKCKNPLGPLVKANELCSRFREAWTGDPSLFIPDLEEEIGGVGQPLSERRKENDSA